MNNVTLKGTIVKEPVFSHQTHDENFFESAIRVDRLSGQPDIIPLIVSENLLDNLATDEPVVILGQFRSYNKIVNDKTKLILSVFVFDISRDVEVSNPNIVTLSGYICKPPIYRVTPFGRYITDVMLAVNRSYDRSDYIPLIVWGRNATFAKTLPVGTELTIKGRIQSREYVKNNITMTAYEVSVSQMTAFVKGE